jgi:hypothetical protein
MTHSCLAIACFACVLAPGIGCVINVDLNDAGSPEAPSHTDGSSPDAGASAALDAGVDGGTNNVNAGTDAGMDAGADAAQGVVTDAGVASGLNGLLGTDPNFLPIGIPAEQAYDATAYRDMGINLYTQGLPDFPYQQTTTSDLATLQSNGLGVFLGLGAVSQDLCIAGTYASAILGWGQRDEPDNAQWDSATNSYGPCIDPSVIVNNYNATKAADPTRPVFINFGRHSADTSLGDSGSCGLIDPAVLYSEYAQGADIVSFDIYPVVDGCGLPLTVVADGVDHLMAWGGGRPVWAYIETVQQVANGPTPTPDQVKAEVWLALTHGAVGIQYYDHQYLGTPQEIDDGLVQDPVMGPAVQAINAQITNLAAVLNSPTVNNGATVSSTARIDLLAKQLNGLTYLFAVNPTTNGASATFTFSEVPDGTASVIDEARSLTVSGNSMTDTFDAYAVHLYSISPGSP